jgi:hypothetical protein
MSSDDTPDSVGIQEQDGDKAPENCTKICERRPVESRRDLCYSKAIETSA